MVGRLDVIGAWSDKEERLVQVVYEDSKNGTIYISRMKKGEKAVTVVDVDGEITRLSYVDFIKLKNGA